MGASGNDWQVQNCISPRAAYAATNQTATTAPLKVRRWTVRSPMRPFSENDRLLKHHTSGIEVHGIDVLPDTRCAHYHSALDIIGIRFKCCDRFYPCFECHSELTDHEAERWTALEFHEKAILCGACGSILSVQQYLDCVSTCPLCRAAFNPKCALHYDLYFDRTTVGS